jgi:hypothetical protein
MDGSTFAGAAQSQESLCDQIQHGRGLVHVFLSPVRFVFADVQIDIQAEQRILHPQLVIFVGEFERCRSPPRCDPTDGSR